MQRRVVADFFPASSAPLVDQYLAANGIVLGKANLGELQSGYATNPTSNGITTALNPYDPTRTASGQCHAASLRRRLVGFKSKNSWLHICDTRTSAAHVHKCACMRI